MIKLQVRIMNNNQYKIKRYNKQNKISKLELIINNKFRLNNKSKEMNKITNNKCKMFKLHNKQIMYKNKLSNNRNKDNKHYDNEP